MTIAPTSLAWCPNNTTTVTKGIFHYDILVELDQCTPLPVLDIILWQTNELPHLLISLYAYIEFVMKEELNRMKRRG